MSVPCRASFAATDIVNWYLSVGAVLVQLALSMLLLRREFTRRLTFPAQPKMDGTALASAMVAAE